MMQPRLHRLEVVVGLFLCIGASSVAPQSTSSVVGGAVVRRAKPQQQVVISSDGGAHRFSVSVEKEPVLAEVVETVLDHAEGQDQSRGQVSTSTRGIKKVITLFKTNKKLAKHFMMLLALVNLGILICLWSRYRKIKSHGQRPSFGYLSCLFCCCTPCCPSCCSACCCPVDVALGSTSESAPQASPFIMMAPQPMMSPQPMMAPQPAMMSGVPVVAAG
mmetsp:Transcript_37529/g.79741  ORF Transcript_37529/g.79741 Transcript_37529/m.79741 type:complete len:218 (+) Transcript_37529:89-742(+)